MLHTIFKQQLSESPEVKIFTKEIHEEVQSNENMLDDKVISSVEEGEAGTCETTAICGVCNKGFENEKKCEDHIYCHVEPPQ